MQEITVNYLAIVVATAANFVLGMLWYGPLFGKQWMAMMGITPESMKTMKPTPMQAMALGFLSTLVMAFVLAHFAAVWGAMDVAGALTLAFWVWLGFVAPVLFGMVIWENKSVKLYALNVTYQLVSLSLLATIIVLWK